MPIIRLYLGPRTTKGHTSMPNPTPEPEVITVSSHRVACDGVGGALGHPRVWLELGEAGVAECGYCDRKFVLARSAEESHAPGVYEAAGGH